MLQFLDSNGNPLPPEYGMTVPPARVGDPFQVQFECRAGMSFFAEPPAFVIVEARLLGDTSWIDIEANPILLDSYAPNLEIFEVRITSPDTEGEYDIPLKLEVV